MGKWADQVIQVGPAVEHALQHWVLTCQVGTKAHQKHEVVSMSGENFASYI